MPKSPRRKTKRIPKRPAPKKIKIPARSKRTARSPKKSVSSPKKSSLPKGFVSQNQPQIESLLSEIEYGEGLAPYFDIIYSESVIRQIQEPFYRMLIGKYGLTSACDLSCRTGQTLRLLDSLGVKTLAGVDVSPIMIDKAKAKLRPTVKLLQSELFLAPQSLEGQTFDLVLCTKDSLPLVLDDEALLNFFAAARQLLTERGILLIELWNYEKIWRRKERFMPVMDRQQDHELLFFIENDFHQELLVRNTIRIERDHHEWFLRPLSVPARPVTRNEMEFFVKEAQYSKWGFMGNYAGSPYNPSASPYCILIAKK